MDELKLAFRAIGDFIWPPVPIDDVKPVPTPGMVEVFFLMADGANKSEAIMRWTRIDEKEANKTFNESFLKEPVPLQIPGPTERLHGFTAQKLSDFVARTDTGKGFALRLGESDTASENKLKGRTLKFHGAVLIDQFFVEPGELENFPPAGVTEVGTLYPNPALRMPLMPSWKYKNTIECSGLVFAQFKEDDKPDLNDNFRVDAILSDPIEPEGKGGDSARSICIDGVFRSRPKLGEEGLMAILVVNGNDVWGIKDPPPSLLPKAQQVYGGFNLARHATKDHSDVPVKTIWPLWLESPMGPFLRALGMETGSSDTQVNDLAASWDVGPDRVILRTDSQFPDTANNRENGANHLRIQRQRSFRANLDKPVRAGDASIKRNRLTLDLRKEGIVRFYFPKGADITLETDVQTVITDEEVFDTFRRDGTLFASGQTHFEIRLLWSEELDRTYLNKYIGSDAHPVRKLEPLGPESGHPGWFSQAIANALVSMHRTRVDLKHLQPGQSVSFLPELGFTRNTQKVHLMLRRVCAARRTENGTLLWGDRAVPNGNGADDTLTLTLREKNGGDTPEFRMVLPGFSPAKYNTSDHSNDHVHIRFTRYPADHDNDYFVAVLLEALPLKEPVRHPAPKMTGRVGSLFFERALGGSLLASFEDDDLANSLQFHPRSSLGDTRLSGHVEGGLGAQTWRDEGLVSIALTLALHMDRASAVSSGMPEFDGLPNALLIPLSPQVEQTLNDKGFALKISEKLGGVPPQPRKLKVSLFDRSQRDGFDAMLRLQRHPWSVIALNPRALSGLGTDEKAEVAFFDAEEGVWKIRSDEQVYRYVLPSMVTGESADKPGRLELHDREESNKGAAPYPDDHEDGLRRYGVESRLSPSIELWVDPADRAQSLVTAPWDTNELFTGVQEGGSGARFLGLRGEFLYAMPVAVDGSRRASPARVAELTALLGQPSLSAVEGVTPDKDMNQRWKALSAVYASRPERLEVWQPMPGDFTTFAPARFDEHVTYALRKTAVLRHPNDDSVTVSGKGLTFHPQGLAGGALWPIEQRNLVAVLANNLQSSSGRIEKIALSPHGGDAEQEARFNGNQVRIISSTRNGFVQFLKVEVIGRIGVFWHRAKHVVVYARTVNPTAQFAPGPDNKHRATPSRRAILRKVSEYIEILEPERSYPDFANGEERTSGPVRAVRFQSRIIHVDSFWSEDLGDWGWRVPLWNRGAAVERPQVYEKPQISFVTCSEGGEENATSAQDCTNPQNLFFVADFAAGHDRTDEWLSRPGVDFSTLPPAGELEAKKEDEAATAKGRRAGVSRIPLGQSRFTWLLARAGRKTDMMAGRTPRPVYIDLESVTFSRSAPVVGGMTDDGKTLADDAVRFVFEVARKGSRPFWLYGDAETTPEELSSIGIADAAARTALEQGNLVGAKTALETLNIELTALLAESPSSYQPYWDRIGSVAGGTLATEAKKLADGANSIFGSGQSPCEKLKSELLQGLRRKQMLVVAAIESGREEVRTALQALDAPLTKEVVKTELTAKLVELASPAFEGASKQVAGVGNAIASAHGELVAFQADLRTAVDRARARLDTVNAGYERDKPWSANRLAHFTTQLDDAVNGVRLDTTVALDDLRRRLRAEASGHGDKLSAALTHALGTVFNEGDAVSVKVLSLAERLDETAEQGTAFIAADGALDKLRAELTNKDKKWPFDADEVTAANDLIKLIDDTAKAVGNAAAVVKVVAKEGEELIASWPQRKAALSSEADKVIRSVDKLTCDIDAKFQGALKVFFGDFEPFIDALDKTWADVRSRIDLLIEMVVDLGKGADALVEEARTRLDRILDLVEQIDQHALAVLNTYAARLETSAKGLSDAIAPQNLLREVIAPKVFGPAIDTILAPLGDPIAPVDRARAIDDIVNGLDLVTARLNDLVAPGGELEATALDGLGDLTTLCSTIEGEVNSIVDHFGGLAGQARKAAQELQKEVNDALGLNLDELKEKYDTISVGLRGLHNDVETAGDVAQAYAHKVLDQLGDVTKGGLAAAPNNLLRLYSTVSSAPEIAALKANVDRIRSRYDALADVVNTTKAKALFDALGDRLKALGLDIPFDRIGRSILPAADLGNLKFGNLFPNIGSLKLDDLFPNVFAPGALKDYVTITHDFDEKAGRAWLHVDVKVPLPQRSTLFALGPFNLDFVRSEFTGQVHIEASKDTKQVSQAGSALIRTDIEAMVGGQKMVGLERVGISYTDEAGLDLDFDPSQIKLNPTMKIIQETVGNLFPEELGGLELIKQNGVPIGMEHVYRMPTVDANAVTSGVMNLFISNRFSILAYPDFVIANRFNVSTKELPFIFSIFILGGTGYLQIDSEYRPFDKRLAVTVTAAAGASAALAFAFGPVSGSVFVALTIDLSYQRVIGATRAEDRGTGLTVALSLVIAGNVNVCGIVSVYIGILLDMIYRENGAIDATGVLKVRIRISRFFKISVRTDVKYKLRGGRSTTQVSTKVEVETDEALQKKLNRLNAARSKLGA